MLISETLDFFIQLKSMYEEKPKKKKYKLKQQPTKEQKQLNPEKKWIERGKKENISDEKRESVGELIDAGQKRKILKYLQNVAGKFEKANIKYRKDRPEVGIQYISNNNNQYVIMRDLINANKDFANERKLISSIYESLYTKVDLQFLDLIVFAIAKVEEKRLKFATKKILSQKSHQKYKHEILFLFAKNQSKFYFTVFDRWNSSVDFNSGTIEKLKDKYPKQYQCYVKFQSKYLKNDKNIEDDYQYGMQQADSDDDRKQRKEKNIFEIRKRLGKLLELDTKEIQESIEKKNEQFNDKMSKNDPNKQQEVQKLGDEIEEQQINLENFQQVRDDVRKKMHSLIFSNEEHEKSQLNLFLKRMIIAQKQLKSQLPILARKRQIFTLLNKHNLVILEGETGSGKSTQLPQLLCEYYKIFENQKALPVLITQPRKLATRTLAERVAFEMQESVHGFVDYLTSGTKTINPNAKIVFKMDRLVLDELASDPILSKYSCLVIDEAHERTISIDVILGLIKNLLNKRKDFKIIVTSASMDTKLFKEYFKTEILKVSGRMFPVKEFFTPYSYEKETVRKIERVIMNEILVSDSKMKAEYAGHILVFCSGVDMINQLVNIFSKRLNPRVFKVFGLHGRLAPEEQKEIFRFIPEYKLIFATRIAETSITIDGVSVVVDPGEDRQMVFDQKYRISSLQLKAISQSSAKQRAGRAGRTNNGFCFRLYSEGEKKKLSEGKTPQINNMALDTLVLRLKSLRIEDILNFPYLSRPSEEGLKESQKTMENLGCLNPKNYEITQVGKLLLKLPIQPFLARAIIQAMLFEYNLRDPELWNCLKLNPNEKIRLKDLEIKSSVVQILCMVIHASNIFYIQENQRQRAEKNKFEKFAHKEGDFYFFLKIYQEFLRYFQINKHQARNWARENFLHIKTLFQVRELEEQINAILRKFVFDPVFIREELMKNKVKLINCKQAEDVLLSSLITSFVTNLSIYSENPFIGYTLLSHQTTVQLYGITTLSLQGINPKWIVCYDLYTNNKGQTFCKVAHQVDFSFLENHVNPYILKTYDVMKLEKENPFYKCIEKNLPTLVFLEVMQDFRKKQFDEYRETLKFLKDFNIHFIDGKNVIQFFYQIKKQTEKNQSIGKSFLSLIGNKFLKSKMQLNQQKNQEEVIEKYLQEIRRKYKKELNINYLGNIYINLDQGFKMLNINFRNQNYCFKVMTKNKTAYQFIYGYLSSFGQAERYPDKIIFHVTEDQNRVDFKDTLAQIERILKVQMGQKITLQEQLVDKRKKIPQAKLFLHFSAGERDSSNLLLVYSDKAVALQSLMRFEKNKKRCRILDGYQMKLSKKGNSINFFYKFGQVYDEYQFAEELFAYKQQGLFGFGFSMPNFIRAFKKADLIVSLTSDKQWEEKIRTLLNREKITDDQVAIRVWGYNPNHRNQKNLSAIEKRQRIEMHAEIKTFNLRALERFKLKYDKQRKILGTEKLHTKFQFEQTAAVTTLKVFEALQDQFEYIKDKIKAEFPLVSIDHFARNFRRLTKIFIKIRGKERDQLIGPAQQIAKLFTPKLIRFESVFFRFLDRVEVGQAILDDIEQFYEYKIYFAFDRKSHSIKLFCQDRLQKEVAEKLKDQVRQYKFHCDEIEYKGKNLHLVIEIVTNEMQTLHQRGRNDKFLAYDILYQKRRIRLTADHETFDKVKNKIMKLVNCEKGECEICYQILQKPYQLFNCKHTFCWACLSSYIREIINQPNKSQLDCPMSADCKSLINIHDIQRVLSEEEFYKLCDLQISRFIERDPSYHGCFSANCEQIFIKKETLQNKSFECEVCGKWYCWKCRESHKGYTCQDWKNHELTDESLKKMGIKKCPKCGTGIQKNQGCEHMTCGSCKAHICWKCMKYFSSSTQCYDHLAKVCGGIFNGNIRQ